MKRSVPISLALFLGASSLMAQAPTTKLIDVHTDPFDIGQNCFFFASAGGGTPSSSSPGTEGRREIKEILTQLSEALNIISANHAAGRQINVNSLAKLAINGSLQSLDPHSNYFDPAEYAEFLEEQQSEYSGIGATIVNYHRNGQSETYVLGTVPGSPAASAKVTFGDRIVRLNGEDFSGRASEDVRDAIRGTAGTKLRLTIEKASTGKLVTLELRRRPVSQPSVSDTFVLPGGYGFIRISEGFNYTTAAEVSDALRQLHRQNIKGIILDLRNNPGGILDQAVSVAERFLPAGSVIVSQRGRSSMDNRVYRSTNSSPETMPLIVLVNGESASASEIVAGALQDHDRALIVGERTFGKGLVQSLIDVPGNAGLTLTTARYFTPSGRSIQRDYSKGNLYDYYSHRVDGNQPNGPAAHTTLNRPVYGGDGIQPDEEAKHLDPNETQLGLIDTAFFFAKDKVNDRLQSSQLFYVQYLNAAESERTDPSFNERLFTEFESYVVSSPGNPNSRGQLEKEREFIVERLKYNLVMAARGEPVANRLLFLNDPVVRRALSLFPKAQDLALAGKTAH